MKIEFEFFDLPPVKLTAIGCNLNDLVMMLKKAAIFSFCILTLFIFFSGIIRHDVKEEKYLKLAQKKAFNCVGQVYIDTRISGSCVLISDRFVLSAAHVFIDRDSRPDTIELNGQTIISSTSYNHRETDVTKIYLEFNGQRVKVKNLILLPNYLDSMSKGSCDLALLELEHPLKNINPAKVNMAFDELNSNVVGVGYGVSGPADRPEMVAMHSKKIAGENVVDSMGGQKYLDYETILICDFDHPTREDCNKTGSPIPRPLEYISAAGDSGGGLFRKNKRKWELIGICKGSHYEINQFVKTGYYGQIMQWTRVSVFTQWIDEYTRNVTKHN